MNHFVTIETQIRDVAVLEEACAELGVNLLRDAGGWRWSQADRAFYGAEDFTKGDGQPERPLPPREGVGFL